MDKKIIKDIRYFEIEPDDYTGPFDGILGNIYFASPDTKYIGQRIARKLNESGFISGEFDHLYLNLSTKLAENDISESDVFLDKHIRHFNYGIKPSVFNKLTDNEKDTKIKDITFKVLDWIYRDDNSKIQLISSIKSLTEKYGKHLTIKYKTKETSHYRIDLSFQIRPENDKSKLMIEYTDKKDNYFKKGVLDILDYEDLYSLVDKLTLEDGIVVFQPKKSYHAKLVAGKYKNPPIRFEISTLAEK